MAIDENKQKALAAALGQIEKQFGKGSIMRLGEDRSMDVENHLYRFGFHWISRLGRVVCRWAVSSKSTDRKSSGKNPR
ncbi:recombinase A [Escherichia coli]|uniref:Recombinase A n=1 Tax=Escherichia coli TaxID=562 RepID=A0A376KN12_ECOLX|nr:recombinase A [Escherichia coli]